MQKHTLNYMQGMGFDSSDTILCEVCGKVAVDLHHINARGMGGSKERDNLENIMALDRECHIKYGDKKQYKEFLKNVHYEFMERHNRL